jgi:AraC-like DNA-binding protein
LIESDRSILDICFESGFTSTSHFNREFRIQRGLTPREYRNHHTGLSF